MLKLHQVKKKLSKKADVSLDDVTASEEQIADENIEDPDTSNS